jgi:TPR repeat protein
MQVEEARRKQRQVKVDELFHELCNEMVAAFDAYKTGDYGKALELFQKYAEQGDADAQFMYGRMHFNGRALRRTKLRHCTGMKKLPSRDMESRSTVAASCILLA